ncbi:hypothetical protein EDM57_04220 [Brevibacillus gelatini]|uniref:Uncharacterized protein n=1 Tax=Brevibacillus gelatini TaxID=1655277 RepID=A0A3M8B7D0_9BACL|nr:hypothetical protein [Brevibacillus gelatini]RNB59354.1 hypothetical protein EDM57_04220 [Brevibacillus gelatini]
MGEKLKEVCEEAIQSVQHLIKEIELQESLLKEQLAESVSESIFLEINKVLIKDEDYYSKRQRIAYIIGQIVHLKEFKVNIQNLVLELHNRFTAYKIL